MELQPFGYVRTFLKWASVVLFPWARTSLDRSDSPRAPAIANMMRELAERAYFVLCRALGWLLRSARYSKARIVYQDGVPHVRKHRLFYAPLLVWMGGPLVRILDTGVRVLPQREWEERERRIYQSLRGSSIQIDADGVLVLPLPRWKDAGDLAGGSGRWRSRSGRVRSNRRLSPSPSSITWDSHTATPWPRT